MEFLKNNPKWIRQPKQVQISEDKVVILTERGTDLWARTYYGFQNDNAPVFQVETTDKYFSFIVKTEFESTCRFDQCGVELPKAGMTNKRLKAGRRCATSRI